MRYRFRADSKRFKKVSFWLSEDEHRALKQISLDTNQTMTNFILKALNDKLNKREKNASWK